MRKTIVILLCALLPLAGCVGDDDGSNIVGGREALELFVGAGVAGELGGLCNRLVSWKQPSGGTVIASATGSIGGKTVALGGSAAVSSAKAIHTFE